MLLRPQGVEVVEGVREGVREGEAVGEGEGYGRQESSPPHTRSDE